MLLLGHAAVSARRGPRGTCQKTRAALWAPAECGVTARSASDGVDVNGIRVHHRRLQYRRYQCGMFRRETPSRPRIPCVYGLEVGVGGGLGCWEYVSRSLFRGFAAKGALLWDGWGMWLLRQLVPTINYPWHTCAKTCPCYTCNCCFRAGWNSPLAVNRAVSKGCRGAGEVPATEPMSPRPVCALVRMSAELVKSQYQRLESG